ncbi:MAG: hypothetical protein IT449_03780 [Phycisphaerales bacterium]|nr:hypothetical protein [Phycisphaerales bacterium]
MTGLRKYAKSAWRLAPLTCACVAGVALLALVPGCPITNPEPSVTLDCGGGDALLGEVVTVSADLANDTGTIAITASGGTVVDDGEGSATVTSDAEGTITVTATATLSDGSTITDTCEIAFAGAGAVVEGDTPDVGAGGTVNLTVDVAALGAGGGEGDDFTFTWSVNPSTAGTFSCGDADQDSADDNDTDCASIGFTAADPCADAVVSVSVTRNSDDHVFSASFAINCIECAADTDCDDGNACTTDACTDGECSNTAVNCDDGVFCNGTETCNAETGACDAGVSPCEEGQVCDEDTDTCTGCADDTDCDNGLFCDGSETCVDGACVDGASPCADGETCTEEDGCVSTTCADDSECDDGLFCNGVETCVDGVCTDGARPCDDTDADGNVIACDAGAIESCSEGDNEAVCTECPGDVIAFSLNQDDLSGTSGDDEFSAPLQFVESSGLQVATLQTGDAAEGLAGDDVLNATFNTNALNVVPTLSGIEDLNFTAFDDVTINSTSITGVTDITSLNSVDDVSVTNIPNILDGHISGMVTSGKKLYLYFQDTVSGSPTTGSSDAIDLTVSGTTTGTFEFKTAANGFESATIESSGSSANTLTAITQTTGTTLATATFTGDAALTVNTMPNTVLTYVATGASGGLQLGSGTDAAGGATTYTTFATANLTDLDAGEGDDTLIFAATFNTNDFTSNTVDMGAGTDTVQATFATDYGTSMPFRNLEYFRFNATASSTVNMTSITGLTRLINEADGTATAVTLQNIPATSGAFPMLMYRGNNTQATNTYDTVTYAATGVTGSSDSLTIDVNNRGTALNTGSGTSNVHTIGAITAAGFETINVDVADGPATFSGITASTMTSFDLDTGTNVPSGGTITLGTVAPSSAVLVTVDCSGVTANLSGTFDWLASGASITTSTGNDTVTAGANSTATTLSVNLGSGNDSFSGDTDTNCAETITAGAGTDTIQAEGGNATITSGDGADTVLYTETGTAEAADSCDDTTDACSNVADFTAGSGGDVMKFDISDLGLAGGTEYVGVIGSLTANSSDEIVILTGVGYASNDAMENAVAGQVTTDGLDMIIIYWNSAAGQTWIVRDTDAGADGGDTTMSTLGKLINITSQASHDLLTTANIDSQS